MPANPQDRRLVRFGVFEADLRSGELRKSGVRIRLRDQAFQVLTELLERPGEVVTREELRDRLWPDGTFVDFDHSLNAAVNSIREVLGDSAASPRFVETLPRRGYRFIAPVERPPGSAAPALGPAPHTPARGESEPTTEPAGDPAILEPAPAGAHPAAGPRKLLSPRHAVWAASLVLLAAVLAMSYGLLSREKTEETQARLSPKKTYLTSYPRREIQPSFSPDGSQVAFAWGDEPQRDFNIYVKLIDVEPPRQITTNLLQEFNPVWSPDGRWIAFLRKLNASSAEVFLIDPFGNRERKLTKISVVASFRMRHLAWSPDSKDLVFVDKSPPAEGGSLFLISIDSGEKRRLTAPPLGTFLDASPAFSPDGRKLAFVRFGSASPQGDLYLLDPSRDRSSEAELQRLTFDGLTTDIAGWAPSGTHVLYSARTSSGVVLRRVGASGGNEPESLASLGSILFAAPALSNDGKRLVYGENVWDTRITRLDLAEGSDRPVSKELIDSTRMELHAEYSPDGSRIAFASNQSGAYEIWRSNRDGSKPVRLTSMSWRWCANIRWSRDGRRIVFNAVGGGPQDIWAVDSEGGAARGLIGGESSEDSYPNFSRDGKWIYFTSNRGGQFDVWKVSTDGGDPIQVTTTRAANGIESVDGESLFYIKDHFPEWETSLWRVPLGGGQEEKVLDSVMRNYVVVEDGIYFLSQTHPSLGPSDSYTYLQFHRFETGAIEVIAELGGGWKDQGFSVSPDGRSFLFPDPVSEGSDLVMLEDFQ